MRRRQVLRGVLAAALLPGAALAQARLPRVGLLAPFSRTVNEPAILERLAELGYRRGSTMLLESRSADGVDERYPMLARELIDAKCDLIFSLGNPASRALRNARTPVPVVFLIPDHDPLEIGIVDSLRRPEGNMTGVYSPAPALAAKRLEVAMEVLPGARRFLVLADTHSAAQLAMLRKAADARGARLMVVEYAKPPYDLEGAFRAARQAGVDALIGFTSPLWGMNVQALSALMSSYRIPAFVTATYSSAAGVLVAFSHDVAKLAHRAAELGVQILRGAKPAEIPVQQPDGYELVLNLNTARTLGIKIPLSVLARATRVIE